MFYKMKAYMKHCSKVALENQWRQVSSCWIFAEKLQKELYYSQWYFNLVKSGMFNWLISVFTYFKIVQRYLSDEALTSTLPTKDKWSTLELWPCNENRIVKVVESITRIAASLQPVIIVLPWNSESCRVYHTYSGITTARDYCVTLK